MTVEITMNNDRADAVYEALNDNGFECQVKKVSKTHKEVSIVTDSSKLAEIGKIVDSI